jgi:hypothetical protein
MSPEVEKPVRVVAWEGATAVPRRLNVTPKMRVEWFLNKKLVIEFIAAMRVDVEAIDILRCYS